MPLFEFCPFTPFFPWFPVLRESWDGWFVTGAFVTGAPVTGAFVVAGAFVAGASVGGAFVLPPSVVPSVVGSGCSVVAGASSQTPGVFLHEHSTASGDSKTSN